MSVALNEGMSANKPAQKKRLPAKDQTLESESDDFIKSTLVLKNITVLGKRTSIRLEPEMWRAIKQISAKERCSIHDLCSLIQLRKKPQTSLTAAIRVFLMLYFRAAATEAGHVRAGHGNFEQMKHRAGMHADWSALKHSRTPEQENSENPSVQGTYRKNQKRRLN